MYHDFVLLYDMEGTMYKMKNKTNTTLSDHFQNPIENIVERGKIDTLKYKYMTYHLPGFVLAA